MNQTLSIQATSIHDLKLVERRQRGDSRGFLSRLFCADELRSAGWHLPIAQVNHTYTANRGTVRGMHFQHQPFSEMKLVTCIRGEVWDVAVDVRNNSPSFLEHFGVNLSATNKLALLIPEGFAHGFQSLTDDVELLYLHSQNYNPDYEGGLHPEDGGLCINWPLKITQLSDRDNALPGVSAFGGLEV